MAGLFGLFGGRTKYVDETDSPAERTEKKDAFYLDPDSAKSLGDAEFMRKPITIKRSFPKTLKGEGAEVVQQVSSLEKRKLKENGQPETTNASISAPTPESAAEAPKTQRRSGDSNLDAFRKMARDLKK
ncbi:MAG: hypothetical protein GC158_03655 [Cyanobacteria bacterium RI_101]|nr:hypothetical protein [Cyanobacteria bacterium RI_101]